MEVKQVKLFNNRNINVLEEEMNKWLLENSELRITGTEVKVSAGSTYHPPTFTGFIKYIKEID